MTKMNRDGKIIYSTNENKINIIFYLHFNRVAKDIYKVKLTYATKSIYKYKNNVNEKHGDNSSYLFTENPDRS